MWTPRARHLSFVAALVVGAVVLTSCGSDSGGAAGAGSVTIYSGRNEELIQPILDEFTDATGIDVNVKYGDSADLALLIDEEAAAGNVQPDVFLSQSPGALGFLEQNDRLDTLPQATLDRVPESVRDDAGEWVGFSGRKRTLVYNSELVDEADLPTSVLDMTDPKWKGKIGIAPSNGSFQDFVTAMRITEGDDVTTAWLEGIAANDPLTFPANAAIVAAVGRGEIEVGLVNHYYNYRALAEDPNQPTLNHYFADDDPGSLIIVTGAAPLAGADNADGAVALIDFLLSSEGQQYFAEQTFEYPLTIGEALPAGIPPIDFSQAGSVRFEDLGDALATTRQMIADAGLEG
jgi:iron(III) transport system substrate-binding protein